MRIGSIAMALLMAGCSATADDAQLNPTEVETAAGLFTIHLTPSADPYASGVEVELDMDIHAGDSDAVDTEVAVTPFMPDMGHGIDDAPTISGGDGQFTAHWTFSMAGYWELDIEVTAPDGTDTATVAYDVE